MIVQVSCDLYLTCKAIILYSCIIASVSTILKQISLATVHVLRSA